jgi:hypothetical protein
MADSSSTQGMNMSEVAPSNLGTTCYLLPMSHHTKEDDQKPPVVMQEPPVMQPPTPDGWSRLASDLLAAGSGEPDEVDDIPLGASAVTPCHREVLPREQPRQQQQQKQRQRQQQQQHAPSFFHDGDEDNTGGAGICPQKTSSGDSPQAIADILCEEAMAWEARMQDANARLEEMKEQSERRIRELEFQVSRLALENTNLKKQLYLGAKQTDGVATTTSSQVSEVARPNNRPAVGTQSARVPLVSSTHGPPPTPLRHSSRSARETVEAIARTSSGMLQQFPRSTLLRNQIRDGAAVATATVVSSPRRAHTKSPPRRQHFPSFSSEFALCPPLLDGRWHPAAGGVTPAMVR